MKEAFGWSHTQYSQVACDGRAHLWVRRLLERPDRRQDRRQTRHILIGSAGAALFNLLFGFSLPVPAKHATVTMRGTVVAGAGDVRRTA